MPVMVLPPTSIPCCRRCGKALLGPFADPHDAPALFSQPEDWQCIACWAEEAAQACYEAGMAALRRYNEKQEEG